MVDNLNSQNKQQQQQQHRKQQLAQFFSDRNKFLRPENMTILNEKSSVSSLSNKSSNASPTSFNWSSNVSMKSLLLDTESIYERSNKIIVTDTDEEKTVCSGKSKSNFFLTKSNENLRIQEQMDRPMTARSLPAKVENEENQILFNQTTVNQYNKLKLTDINSKNFSCPLLSSSQIKLIQVTPTNDEVNDEINDETNFYEDDSIKISSNHVNSKKLENKQGNKSNLDKYLEYTMSPFTTKFEIIGDYLNDSIIKRASSSSQLNSKQVTFNSSSSANPSSFHSNSSTNNLYSESTQEESYLIDLNTQKYILDRFNSPMTSEATAAVKTNFIQITDYLYIGNMGSIKNERKMCKFGIEYLIDMTNMRPDDLNRKTLGKLPCSCKKQHSRFHLAVEIADTSFKTLFKSFLEVNKIIQNARNSKMQRKVLIFGINLFEQQVLCACIQYLMVEYELTFDEGLETIYRQTSSHCLQIKMNNFFIDYLKRFEIYLKHVSVAVYGYNNFGRNTALNHQRLAANNNTFAFYDFYSNQELKDDVQPLNRNFKYSILKNEQFTPPETKESESNNSDFRMNLQNHNKAQLSNRSPEKKDFFASKVAWM